LTIPFKEFKKPKTSAANIFSHLRKYRESHAIKLWNIKMSELENTSAFIWTTLDRQSKKLKEMSMLDASVELYINDLMESNGPMASCHRCSGF